MSERERVYESRRRRLQFETGARLDLGKKNVIHSVIESIAPRDTEKADERFADNGGHSR